MNTTKEFLQAAVLRCIPATKYRLAKTLGIEPSQLARYMNRGRTMDDHIAIRVAALLDLEPGYVLACVHAERAALPAVKAVWERVAQGLTVLLLALGIGGAVPAALNITHGARNQTTHYAQRRRWWFRIQIAAVACTFTLAWLPPDYSSTGLKGFGGEGLQLPLGPELGLQYPGGMTITREPDPKR